MINYNPREFKVKLRKGNFRLKLREEALQLDGKVLTLVNCGFQGSDETYPGEEMLWAKPGSESFDLLDEVGITWLASGDLIELK